MHAAQVLAHYLMINQLSATVDCCQQMIVHSSEQWDATSKIDCGRPVLLPTLLIKTSSVSQILDFLFLFHYVLQWWVMATMGLWQYIAIAVYW